MIFLHRFGPHISFGCSEFSSSTQGSFSFRYLIHFLEQHEQKSLVFSNRFNHMPSHSSPSGGSHAFKNTHLFLKASKGYKYRQILSLVHRVTHKSQRHTESCLRRVIRMYLVLIRKPTEGIQKLKWTQSGSFWHWKTRLTADFYQSFNDFPLLLIRKASWDKNKAFYCIPWTPSPKVHEDEWWKWITWIHKIHMNWRIQHRQYILNVSTSFTHWPLCDLSTTSTRWRYKIFVIG